MRRRNLIVSSDSDADDDPRQTPPPPNPNPNPSTTIPVEISDSDSGPASSPPPPDQGPGDDPVDSILLPMGLRLRPGWLASCATAVPGFGGLDAREKAKRCFEWFLCADMNVCGAGVLPEGVGRMHAVELEGPFVLQVDEVINMSAPLKERYQNVPAGPKRCLKLSMTDGIQHVFGMEYRPIKALEVLAPAGFKVVISNVHVRRGLLILVPEALELLGGVVTELDAARQRVVCEVNKPPRGKRKTGGVPLSRRASLAAWPSDSSGRGVQDNPVPATMNAGVQVSGNGQPPNVAVRTSSRNLIVPNDEINTTDASGIVGFIRPPIRSNNLESASNLGIEERAMEDLAVLSTHSDTALNMDRGWSRHQQPAVAARTSPYDYIVPNDENNTTDASGTGAFVCAPIRSNNLESASNLGSVEITMEDLSTHYDAALNMDCTLSRHTQDNVGLHADCNNNYEVAAQTVHDVNMVEMEEQEMYETAVEEDSSVRCSHNFVNLSAMGNSDAEADVQSVKEMVVEEVASRSLSKECTSSLSSGHASGSNLSNVDVVNSSLTGPIVFTGEQELPFTYLGFLSAKSSAYEDEPIVQGKVKCIMTGVKKFDFRGRSTYELIAHIDDGSLISEVIVDHSVVQSLIGYTPEEVVACLASSDNRIVEDMKAVTKEFQTFLYKFEGTVLIEINRSSPLPIVRQMDEGCHVSDAWLLLKRLRKYAT